MPDRGVDEALPPASAPGPTSELRNLGYEIFIAALSVLSILNLALLLVIDDVALEYVIYAINVLLSAILFIDFCYRLSTTSSKSRYFFRRYGWADLLASLPVEQLKILRLFRLIRVYRLMREVGPRAVGRSLIGDRAGSALYILLTIAILMLEFGSLEMLRLEDGAVGSTITNASDALWYTIATISTVGYGDTYPVTNAGRLMGAIIIVVGVAIFGTLSGFLANLFLSPRKEKPSAVVDTEPDLRRQLVQLKGLLAEQSAALAEMDRMLAGD